MTFFGGGGGGGGGGGSAVVLAGGGGGGGGSGADGVGAVASFASASAWHALTTTPPATNAVVASRGSNAL